MPRGGKSIDNVNELLPYEQIRRKVRNFDGDLADRRRDWGGRAASTSGRGRRHREFVSSRHLRGTSQPTR